MKHAAAAGAHLLHTSEAALSGYPGADLASFQGYNWSALRRQTTLLREAARRERLYLILGSAHYVSPIVKPTNCLYVFDPAGHIIDRYDKRFLTGFNNLNELFPDDRKNARRANVQFPTGDLAHYSPGNRFVTLDLNGVRLGLAICYDICWPQIYIRNRELGAQVMLHSFHNARQSSPNCLQNFIVREAATRCADNRMWAVCNNSSAPYSEWGSFVVRPDSTTFKSLPINMPGMLVHDFPDSLSKNGWFHNYHPLRIPDDEIMHSGELVLHPHIQDGRAEP
jgi:predicted amidohydrolase